MYFPRALFETYPSGTYSTFGGIILYRYTRFFFCAGVKDLAKPERCTLAAISEGSLSFAVTILPDPSITIMGLPMIAGLMTAGESAEAGGTVALGGAGLPGNVVVGGGTLFLEGTVFRLHAATSTTKHKVMTGILMVSGIDYPIHRILCQSLEGTAGQR